MTSLFICPFLTALATLGAGLEGDLMAIAEDKEREVEIDNHTEDLCMTFNSFFFSIQLLPRLVLASKET